VTINLIKGRTNASQSLFFYHPGESWSTYNEHDFTPQYLMELLAISSNQSIEEAASACTREVG